MQRLFKKISLFLVLDKNIGTILNYFLGKCNLTPIGKKYFLSKFIHNLGRAMKPSSVTNLIGCSYANKMSFSFYV